MAFHFGVAAIYLAAIVWLALFAWALRTNSYRGVILFGMALAVYLNARYFIEGVPAGITFFVGIYDVVNNLFIGPEMPSGMTTCAGPAPTCSVLGEHYAWHTSWGVAFYERFASGPAFRSQLLYAHIGFNTLAFLLLHAQMAGAGRRFAGVSHAVLGRVTYIAMTLGVVFAVWLASQHGPVAAYGGYWSTYGFYSMSACVFGTATMGVIAMRQGDRAGHRIWMWRFAGSMWGSFWLFRVALLILDPLLRDHNAAAIQTTIWLSAPLGILIAEMIRRNIDNRGKTIAASTAPAE